MIEMWIIIIVTVIAALLILIVHNEREQEKDEDADIYEDFERTARTENIYGSEYAPRK